MTREEAIHILKQYNLYSPTRQIEEAIDMSIEALSADAVHIETYRELYEKYVELKHVSADRPQGEWINNEHDIPVCSECGYFTPYDRAIDDYEYGNFCPNCGARMEATK